MFNFRPLQLEAGQWIQLIAFGLFIFIKLARWTQSNEISRGHKILGQLSILILMAGAVLMAFGPSRLTMFRIIVYSTLAIEEAYDYWYFQRYPIPDEHKRTYDVPMPKGIVFVPWQAMIKYLIEPPEPELFWTRHRFRTVILIFMFLFSFAYGFSRWVEQYAKGQQELAAAKLRSSTERDSTVKAAVSAAVDSTKKTLFLVADTIKQGQTHLSGELHASNVDRKKGEAQVKFDLKKTNARLSRPSFIINAPQPRQEIPTNLQLSTDQVKLPAEEQPKKKKRVRRVKYSYVEDRYFIEEEDEAKPDSLPFELAKFSLTPDLQKQ